MTDSTYGLTPSTTREALIAQFGLPAHTTERQIDNHIMATLCARYGLPLNSSVETVERAQFEAHCKRFGIDPKTADAEQQLEARRDALLTDKAA